MGKQQTWAWIASVLAKWILRNYYRKRLIKHYNGNGDGGLIILMTEHKARICHNFNLLNNVCKNPKPFRCHHIQSYQWSILACHHNQITRRSCFPSARYLYHQTVVANFEHQPNATGAKLAHLSRCYRLCGTILRHFTWIGWCSPTHNKLVLHISTMSSSSSLVQIYIQFWGRHCLSTHHAIPSLWMSETSS